jgi:transcriptional regulator with XRE-family HTH domain
MARRGMSARELAKAAGLSAPTVGTALAGRPIAIRSLQMIARTLADIPANEVVDALLGAGGGSVSTLGNEG